MDQEIRFCTTEDGVRLAYAWTGSGPPLVRTAHWLTHLDFDLKSTLWRPWIEGFSSAHSLLRYDERGCGLSDWDVSDFSLDAWVRDLETVVDAEGLDHFPLMGLSQGGPVAIAYAARHPERVTHLILYGTYARGWRRRDLPRSAKDENEARITLVRRGWGRDNPANRQLFAGLFVPDADTARLNAFNELQRVTTSPENAARFLRAFGDLDVSHLLPELQTPTLVLHAHGDSRCPFEEGRKLAAMIPDSRFVQLDSDNHILLGEEPAWGDFLDEIHAFLEVRVEQPIVSARPGNAETEPAGRGRRIVRWTVPYVVGSWVALQVIDVFREPWGIGAPTVRALQVLAVVGLVAIFLAAVAGDAQDRRTRPPH